MLAIVASGLASGTCDARPTAYGTAESSRPTIVKVSFQCRSRRECYCQRKPPETLSTYMYGPATSVFRTACYTVRIAARIGLALVLPALSWFKLPVERTCIVRTRRLHVVR